MYRVKQQVGFPHRRSLLDCMTADIDADCECTGARLNNGSQNEYKKIITELTTSPHSDFWHINVSV